MSASRWPSATASTPICCSRCRVSFHERGRRLIVGRAGFPSSTRRTRCRQSLFIAAPFLPNWRRGGCSPPQVGLVLDAFGSGQQTGIDITWRRRDARSAARARRGTVGALAAEGLGRKGTRRSGRSVGAGACSSRMEIVLSAGERILVGADVDAAAVTRVINAVAAMIPDLGERSGVTGNGAHRHAQGVRRACADLPGDAEARSALRSSVCPSRSPRRSHQVPVAGWAGLCLFSRNGWSGVGSGPSTAGGTVTISTAQLAYLLEGIDWRMPQETRVRRRSADDFGLQIGVNMISFGRDEHVRFSPLRSRRGACADPRREGPCGLRAKRARMGLKLI